ncbi:surface lipoprotein assembly modifier [Neisseria lisongii]|uniref:Surface lipoprotein assembly modifier n=1 Tax=Neisseria lisongii TaxID=2912188 RepID=A0AAW5ADM1_9NEIS|nr:surface lipoprotein assembly modifier [Neisseria lisongii]MCF7529786.1 surface lipoprotein assembly modifier [Neisseria lisongii]
MSQWQNAHFQTAYRLSKIVIMRYFPFFLVLTPTVVAAAPLVVPNNPPADLNREQVLQTEQAVEPLPKAESDAPKSMTKEELLQQPELLHSAMNIALEQVNGRTIRFLLPLYRQLSDADSAIIRYAEALILREDGNYRQAEQALSALAAEYPDHAPLRLQQALTLAQDKQFNEAAAQIEAVRQMPDVPESVQQYLNGFDAALKQGRQWQFYGNAYYQQDDNIAKVPKQRQYGNWHFAEPQSAHGIAYSAAAYKAVPIKGHWAARVQASVYGSFYWDAHEYDDLIARAETGPMWRDAAQEISISPFYEKRWFGTEPYYDKIGGVARYSRILSPKWQLFGAWQSGHKKYRQRTFLDGGSHSASLSTLYRPSEKRTFVFGIGGGWENAKDLSDAYRQSNARISWNENWGRQQNFSTTLETSVQHRRYRSADIFNIQRQETEYAAQLSLSHKKIAYKGFTPRLNAAYSAVDGNHFYYRRHQSKVFIDIGKQF